jgi:Protein of unknown function (DUF3485)
MVRYVPLLTGLLVVLATGLVHGIWSQRWLGAPAAAAAQRLDSCPDHDLGPWHILPVQADDVPPAEELEAAGVERAWGRTYQHRYTHQQVRVLVLAGRTGPLVKHRPEDCYPGAGYELAAQAARVALTDGHALWSARFNHRDVTGTSQMRIYWAWFAGSTWQAPDNPRWVFARQSSLFKIYAVCDTAEGAADFDPATDLLRRLTPVLAAVLRGEPDPSIPPANPGRS